VVLGVGEGGTITCKNAAGNTDIVVDAEGYFSPPGTAGALFNALSTPERLLDTRGSGGAVAAGQSASVTVGGANNIPSNATAGVLNITDIATGPNYLTAFPAGSSAPTAANVNFSPGDPSMTLSNDAYATTGTDGAVDILTATSTANVVVDAFGYFSPSATSTATGNDVSFPQCGNALPSSEAFGIVGVNDGLAGTLNPCFGPSSSYPSYSQSELYWALSTATGASTQPKASLYVNTADPGNVFDGQPVTNWPTSGGNATYGPCTTTTVTTNNGTATVGQDSTACAWQYGYDEVSQDVSWLTQAAGGVDSQESTFAVSNEAGSYPWWLDVETANTWQTGSSGLQMNVGALQGMVAALQADGASHIGVYSTSSQWGQITGGTTSASGSLYEIPNWIPGASGLSGAESNCSATSFTDGEVLVTQWTSNNLDSDYSCAAWP
ncbi:MAG: hypothetical protein ACRD6W_10300, partial [Nitrososphaerales archaeon]